MLTKCRPDIKICRNSRNTGRSLKICCHINFESVHRTVSKLWLPKKTALNFCGVVYYRRSRKRLLAKRDKKSRNNFHAEIFCRYVVCVCFQFSRAEKGRLISAKILFLQLTGFLASDRLHFRPPNPACVHTWKRIGSSAIHTLVTLKCDYGIQN